MFHSSEQRGLKESRIVFSSMYRHIYRMAKAVAEGVWGVEGMTAELQQVPELVPEAVLERSGAALFPLEAGLPLLEHRPDGLFRILGGDADPLALGREIKRRGKVCMEPAAELKF